MKRLILSGFLALLLPLGIVVLLAMNTVQHAGSESTDDDDIRALKQIEIDWAKYSGSDPASIKFAEQHIADTSTTVGMAGRIHHFSKSDFLDGMRTMPATLKTSLQVSDVDVYLYGDTAIVTLHERCTHILARRLQGSI